MDLIDVLGRNLGFYSQGVGIGYDQHDRFTRSDNATNRVHGKLMYDAVLRGSDVDAFKLILGCDLSFHQFRNLRVGVGKIFTHLAAQILIDLNDLQLYLTDFSLGLSPAADELTALALKPLRLALEASQPAYRDKIIRP